MNDVNTIKQAVRNKTIISINNNNKGGGQHCGIIDPTVVVENCEIGIRIEISAYRSQHQNRTYGLLLVDLLIDDIIK